MKVTINQISNRYKIYIDGKLTPMEDVAKRCNVVMIHFRKVLSRDNREHLVLEWLLKAKYGVYSSCKTFWKEGVPMWQPLVIRVIGVNVSTASRRIYQWMKDGDMDRLLRPRYLTGTVNEADVPGVELVTEPVVEPVQVRGATMVKIVKSEPVNTIVIEPPVESERWGGLSNKSRSENLKNIPGPGTYERSFI